MDKQETIKLFALIKMLFPRDTTFQNATQQMVDVWQTMLQDISLEVASGAVQKQASVSPFPPAISEIRRHAADMAYPGLSVTAEEAWNYAIRAVRRFGRGRKMEALKEMPDEVAEFVFRWFTDICNCENVDVIRGQFMKGWENHISKKKEESVIPDHLKQLSARMQLGEAKQISERP